MENTQKIINDKTNDFGDIMIMAIRYGLGRRTYVTSEVPDFIVQNDQHINPRICEVMLRDLEQYIKDRDIGFIKDDDCDFYSWLNLRQWLIALDARQGWGVFEIAKSNMS